MPNNQVSNTSILRNVFLILGIFLILLKTDLSYESVFIFYAAVVLTAISLKNDSINKYGLLFASAMLIRICFCLLIDIFPPEFRYPSQWELRNYSFPIIFKDETYYIAIAKQSLKFVDYIDLSDKYERVTYLFKLIFQYFGQQIIWGRFINSFFSSLIVVLIYNTLVLSLGEKFRKYYWWFCLLTPVLILWSITYIKESYLVIGETMILNSMVIVYKRLGFIRAYFQLIIGAMICYFLRIESLIPFALLLPSVIVGENKESRFIKPITWLMVLSIICLSLLLIFNPLKGLEFIGDKVGFELNIHYTSFNLIEEGYDCGVPLYNWVMKQHGILLGLGYCFLLMESPVITSVWLTLPIIGDPSWDVFGTSAYSISWWICIPFLLNGVWQSFREKNLFWLTGSAIFIIWFLIAAFARMGAGMDAVRYRDSMFPLVVLITGKGFYHIAEAWDHKLWNRIYIKAFFAGVVALILARGFGLIKMG
jgi:hypothetical protein